MRQPSWPSLRSFPAIAIGLTAIAAALSCGSTTTGFSSDGGNGGNGDATTGDDDASGVFTSSDGATGAATADGDGGCASANVELTRAAPSVWLLLDGGNEALTTEVVGGDSEGATVWDSTRAALFGPGGLLPALQQQVSFGLLLDGSDYEATPCPTFMPIAPALDASSAFQAAYPVTYPAAWNGYLELQPYALNYVLAHLPTAQQRAADPTIGQQAVIVDIYLPTMCFADFSAGLFADGGPPNEDNVAQAERLTIDAITALTKAGVKVYLFAPNGSTGGGDAAYFDAALAATNTGSSIFTPANTADLVAAMTTIAEGLLSCDVTLNGSVGKGLECSGTVAIDGTPVPCDTADGWDLKDPSTVEFVGAACTSLRAKPMAKITAAFPCTAFEPTR